MYIYPSVPTSNKNRVEYKVEIKPAGDGGMTNRAGYT